MQATSQGSDRGMSVGRVALASAIGTTIEWYDFFLYGVVTPIVLNKLFFPNYDPIAGTLLVLRVCQGIGIGGEWGGAVLMAVEHSPEGRRGFYGSWPQIGVPAGLLLSSGMVYLLSFLPESDFFSWGWRISFLISAVLVGIGLYIRLKIMETPVFVSLQRAQRIVHVPFFELISTHGWNTLLGLGARYIEGVKFNIFGVFVIAYI